jgi:hypothetical protein
MVALRRCRSLLSDSEAARPHTLNLTACRELLCRDPEEPLYTQERRALQCPAQLELERALGHPFNNAAADAELLRSYWRASFPGRLYALCHDMHSGPAACNQEVLWDIGVVLHAETDYHACRFTDTCIKRQNLVRGGASFGLEPCAQRFRRQFFEANRDNPEMARADIVFCSHPAANSELYLPLNRSLVVYVTTRLEFGRDDDSVWWRKPQRDAGLAAWRWRHWVENLQAAARSPWVGIAANNVFDVHYVRYHTGITPEYIPSWCGGVGARYQRRSGRRWLVGPTRDNLAGPFRSEAAAWKETFLRDLAGELARAGGRHAMRRIAEEYPQGYQYADLATHPGIILVPYQVSTMSFFEFYRMEIPLFAPSLDLMVELQRKHRVCFERVYGHPRRHTDLLSETELRAEPFDPTAEDEASLRYWLNMSDFFVHPHVVLFDSWRHLVQLLDTAPLDEISAKMAAYNREQHVLIRSKWAALVGRISRGSPGSRPVPRDLDRALTDLYNLSALPPDPPEGPARACGDRK